MNNEDLEKTSKEEINKTNSKEIVEQSNEIKDVSIKKKKESFKFTSIIIYVLFLIAYTNIIKTCYTSFNRIGFGISLIESIGGTMCGFFLALIAPFFFKNLEKSKEICKIEEDKSVRINMTIQKILYIPFFIGFIAGILAFIVYFIAHFNDSYNNIKNLFS